MKDNKLLTMPVGKLVWNVSFPLMLSLLVQSLYNIVDGIYVARLSVDALTATSLAYPVQMLMIALSVGTGVGLNAFLSKSLGEKKRSQAAKIAGCGIFIGLCEWLVFLLFGAFLSGWFAGIYADDAAIAAQTTAYLRIVCMVSIGVFVAVIGERCLQATGKTWLSMASQVTGCVINIILDPILIFGWLGLPSMGVAGAAIATVTGQCASAITALLLNKYKNPEAGFGVTDIGFDGKITLSIFKVGAPTIVMQACGSFMTMGINAILGGFSSIAVAFFGAYYKLQNFLYLPLNGLAQSLIPIVGYNYGAHEYDRIKQAFRQALKMAVSFMAIGTLLFWLIPGPLLRMFTSDEQVLSIGIFAMRILSVGFVMTGITVTIGYYFTGLQNGIVNMVCTLLRQIVILLPCALLFSRLFGIQGVWFAFWIGEAAALGTAIFCYKKYGNLEKIKIRASAKPAQAN